MRVRNMIYYVFGWGLAFTIIGTIGTMILMSI